MLEKDVISLCGLVADSGAGGEIALHWPAGIVFCVIIGGNHDGVYAVDASMEAYAVFKRAY